MGWFDAICHSFSTVSLGGFSSRSMSLAYFQSLSIELVAGVFSILAAVNFALYFSAWYRRSLNPLLVNSELRFFLLALTGVVIFSCGYLSLTNMFPLREALYHGFF